MNFRCADRTYQPALFKKFSSAHPLFFICGFVIRKYNLRCYFHLSQLRRSRQLSRSFTKKQSNMTKRHKGDGVEPRFDAYLSPCWIRTFRNEEWGNQNSLYLAADHASPQTFPCFDVGHSRIPSFRNNGETMCVRVRKYLIISDFIVAVRTYCKRRNFTSLLR